MDALYSIKSETLTDICDALRSELGETKQGVIYIPAVVYTDVPDYTVISIPGATTLHLDATYTTGFLGYYQIAPGELTSMPADAIKLQNSAGETQSFTLDTDTITIYSYKGILGANTINATIIGTDADGNYVDFEGASYLEEAAIVKNTFQSDEITGAIREIISDKQVIIDEKQAKIDELEKLPMLPEEALTITGDCYCRFAYNGWNWLIDNYGDKVTTSDITECSYMFRNSTQLKEIPFEINCSASASYINMTEIFNNCQGLRSIPRIYAKVGNLDKMFYNCYRLRELPEDFADSFDWSYSDGLTSSLSGKRGYQFYACYSLRKIPMSFLEHGNPVASYTNSIYNTMCQRCHSLDEIVDLPNPHLSATWTSNAFNSAFSSCNRLKNLTFKTPNGVPYVVKWKSQTIDLNSNVGYAHTSDVSFITNYNSGITADKQVTDDATYAALKNDPDWFTTDIAYSRYNHDSAVATINSLPDTSAYLATTTGTNTIKFKGAAGSATDGGAINTLTDAEIAVAAAKGWTVTLV